jgi:hypothetical protein
MSTRATLRVLPLSLWHQGKARPGLRGHGLVHRLHFWLHVLLKGGPKAAGAPPHSSLHARGLCVSATLKAGGCCDVNHKHMAGGVLVHVVERLQLQRLYMSMTNSSCSLATCSGGVVYWPTSQVHLPLLDRLSDAHVAQLLLP